MSNAEEIRVESDERGFELHICMDEDPHVSENGWMVVNVHGCAEALYDAVRANIGAWLQERDEARATLHRAPTEDDLPWPGESAIDFYQRTGNAEPALDAADFLRDRMRGK